MSVSIGVAGALGPELIGRLAPDIEAAGFDGLWVNDTPGADALAALAAAARVTERLRLATGVVPVDRRPVGDIVDAVHRSGLPLERTTIGIGSGAARSRALRLVAQAAEALRDLRPAHVAIGALGPRMRRLAAESADELVLNWLTPEIAAQQAAAAHALAPDCRVVLYIRTALEGAASARLGAEADRYASFPSYAANFTRLGVEVSDTVIDGARALRSRIPEYRSAVDEVVLRAITPDDGIEAYRSFLRTASAALG